MRRVWWCRVAGCLNARSHLTRERWSGRQGEIGGRGMDEPIFSEARSRQGVTLLVIRPHPDDESIATGGMLASYSMRGVRTGG